MKIVVPSLLLFLALMTSCQEDPKLRALEQEKETQKREVIFNNINKGWTFNTQPINTTSRELTNSWAEWRLFLYELGQKPKSSIGAFQQKAKTLSKKAAELNNNIPIIYNVPEVRSRIEAICTKLNSINLYIHLNQIPDKKIVLLVQDVTTEVVAFQRELDEIVVKKQIKIEDGESDMLRMLDTTRAIPTQNPNAKIIK